ncbi:MAG: hypothetical protein HY275_04475 [Gemmatimonadetes bacterium]|nr:hypothetical protein [Gemmatimonadota bacterium]
MRDSALRSARARAARAESLAYALGRLDAERHILARDTSRAGGITVASAPALTLVTRRALDSVAPSVVHRWGAAPIARALTEATLRVYIITETVVGIERSVVYADVERGGPSERSASLSLGARDSVAVIGAWISRTVAELVGERLGSPAVTWLGKARIADPEPPWTTAFEDLVTAPAAVSRRCAAGELPQCALALGVVAARDPKAELYSEEDRRVVARAWWGGRVRGRTDIDPERNPCRPRPITPACHAYVDSLAPAVWTRPLGAEARLALLATAVTLGGEQAWGRFVADTALPVAARLEAAAGRPLADVMAAWRSRLMEARPEPVRPRTTALFASALSVLAVLAVAIVRRERA